MADFNIKVQDAGYTGIPRLEDKVYNFAEEEALAKLIGDVVPRVAGKILDDSKKENLEAPMRDFRKAAEYNATLEGMSPEQRRNFLYANDVSRHDENTDQLLAEQEKLFEQGKLDEKQIQAAIVDADKRMKVARAKSDQLGANFNFQTEMYRAYSNLAEKYGEGIAATVYQKLAGDSGSPLKFLNENIIQKAQEAREKAQDSFVKQTDKMAEALGIVRFAGESVEKYVQRTTDTHNAMTAAGNTEAQIRYLRESKELGNILDPDGRVDKRIKFLEGQLAGSVAISQNGQLLQLASRFNPTNASPEQRTAALQDLNTWRANEAARIMSTFQENDSARQAAMAALDKNVAFYTDVMSGKTAKETNEYSTQIEMLSKLYEFQQQVPMFRDMQVIDQFRNMLADPVFAIKFKSLLADQGGEQIMRYLFGQQATELGTNQVNPANFKTFIGRMTGMAALDPRFARVMSTAGMQAFRNAYDPFTGKFSDPNAAVGALDLLGSKEFFTHSMPYAREQYNSTQMRSLVENVTVEVGKAVSQQLEKTGPVWKAIQEADPGESGSLVLTVQKDTGEVILGMNRGGKVTYFVNQDSDPRVYRARAALGAGLRSLAHINGSQDYSAFGERYFQLLNKNGVNNLQFLRQSEFDSLKNGLGKETK